jgi:hypothetical protein
MVTPLARCAAAQRCHPVTKVRVASAERDGERGMARRQKETFPWRRGHVGDKGGLGRHMWDGG